MIFASQPITFISRTAVPKKHTSKVGSGIISGCCARCNGGGGCGCCCAWWRWRRGWCRRRTSGGRLTRSGWLWSEIITDNLRWIIVLYPFTLIDVDHILIYIYCWGWFSFILRDSDMSPVVFYLQCQGLLGLQVLKSDGQKIFQVLYFIPLTK